jgi:hypothetical protein
MGKSYGFKALHFENQEPQMSVLFTLSVNISFNALGLRPQTPVRRRRWRGLTRYHLLHIITP